MDDLEKDIRSLLCNSNRAIEIDEIAPLLLALIDRVQKLEAAMQGEKEEGK